MFYDIIKNFRREGLMLFNSLLKNAQIIDKPENKKSNRNDYPNIKDEFAADNKATCQTRQK